VGTATVHLDPVTVAPVTPPHAYLGVAESLMPGIRMLAEAERRNVAVPLTNLCGQALECMLKAYLAKNGTPEGELKKHTLRHDLKALWLLANQNGLLTAVIPPPAWLERLSQLHNGPFVLRYPMGLNGLLLPGTQPMLSDLEVILADVRSHVLS